MIYLDNNATTRPLPEAIAAMNSALEFWGNPSSKHALGQDAKRLLSLARADVASLIGAHPNELVFTSGATESNHHVLHGALHRPGAPRRIIMSAIEHSGYMKAALQLKQQGVELVLLDVDGEGRVKIESLRKALEQDAAVVSIMAANNETGVIQATEAFSELARAHNVPFHVDATQIVGKLPLSFAEWKVDLLSFSAHKLHGPKGIGGLVIRKGLNWPSLITGQQERARRGGTENMSGIAGFAAAARHASATQVAEAARQTILRQSLESALSKIPGSTIYGKAADRLANTTYFSITGLSADKILAGLERKGICASSGAACSSGGSEPSHVLIAMGVASAEALGAIRISLGIDTQVEHLSLLSNELSTMALPAEIPAAALS